MRNQIRDSLVSAIRVTAALAFWLGASMPASAQGLGAEGGVPEMADVHLQSETFGTSSNSVLTVGAGNFDKPNDTVTWSTVVSGSDGISIFQTAAPQIDWWQAIHLPNGSTIQLVEVEACDASATGELVFGLTRGAAPGGNAANVTPLGTTGFAATPGCAFFSVVPTSTIQIDNRNNNYWLFMDFSGAGAFAGAVKVNAFRVFYRLQVSAAPALATFPNDVPTSHPFFRFIEALAAAGITGGTGPGSYGPDLAVTRGQMAVFLSTALGLHFPN